MKEKTKLPQNICDEPKDETVRLKKEIELPSLYQSFIHLSRYSRWLDDKGRRENWDETVQRYIDFMYNHTKDNTKILKKDLHELYEILGANCEK